MNNDIYYRPPWTCGKYNADKHVAIMFNTLSRMSYFFEAESADVVGLVLSAGRGGSISVEKVSNRLMISTYSINVFFKRLCSQQLLVENEIKNEDVDKYRKECIGLAIPTAADETAVKTTGERTAVQAYADIISEYGGVFEVSLELTYRCHEQCIHCYNPGATRNDNERSGRGDKKELTLEEYKLIIDDLCANGLTAVSITGGDPFMYPKVWDIIDYLYQNDIATTILTNGLGLVGKEERLAAYFPFLVQCSLYSGESTVHDKITRTPGSWKRTIAVMDRLHELATPIDIACPLMQTNLKSYFSVKPYKKKYGSSPSFDVQLTDSLDGDKCASHHLRLTQQQLEVVLMDPDVIQNVTPNNVDDIDTSERGFLSGAPCSACKSKYCISPNGDVVPCVAFRKVLGNVRTQKTSEIIRTSPFVKQWMQTTAKDYGECYSHDYCFYCMPFCPGNNYNDRGECLNGGENNCYIAKIRYDIIKRLNSGDDILHNKTIEDCINELSIAEDDLQREYY